MTLETLKESLKRQGLNLTDFGIFLIYYEGNGRATMVRRSLELKKKGFLQMKEDSFVLTEDTKHLMDVWLSETASIEPKPTSNKKERYLELADKLRVIYPEGRKSGTSYMWRDNRVTIAKKLQTLADKFQVQFTDEEAIEATKKYVESFNGNYQYMQLLKYFILKRDFDKQEETSQLLSFIENKDTVLNFQSGELIL